MAEIKYVSQDNLIKILGKIKATYVAQVEGKGLSTNDLTNELLQKINTASAGNHSHDNKTVLDGITAEKVTAWDGAVSDVAVVKADYLKAADKTELQNAINTEKGRVDALVGEDANKSVRSISAEEVAKIVAGADTSFDTLKEIADWISTHGTDAASMNSAILALQAIVDGIGGEGEKATVVAYVNDAIAALNIGNYALAADLAALAARVSTLETDVAAIKADYVKASEMVAYTDSEIDSIWNTAMA